MIEPSLRPLLASKARLRFDRHSQGHMLVYPEKGLMLNPTATEVVKLCTGAHSVMEIVDQLQQKFSGTPRERIEQEVFGFLQTLSDRGLLEAAP